MGILDKLVEKKDIKTYCTFRIERLEENLDDIVKNTPKEKRQTALKVVEGRIKELRRLLHLLEGSERPFKEESKKHWRAMNYEGQ